jgi:hypothetical protein
VTALVAVESAVLLVLCVLVAGLLSAYAQVLRRLHALDGGGGGTAAAPPAAPPFRTAAGVPGPTDVRVEGRDEWSAGHDVVGPTLSGELAHVRTVEVEHDTVLAFLSSGCAGCTGFWDELGRPGSWAVPAGSRLVVVAKDEAEESVSQLQALCPPGVDVVLSSAAWSDYEVPGSPYVVVVDGPTGRTKGAGSGSSFSQVTGLMEQSLGDLRAAAVRKPARDSEREADVDRALLEAGVRPGDPSLYADRGAR